MFDLFGNRHEPKPEKSFEERYAEHLASAKWMAVREGALKRAGYKCQKCGVSKWSAKLEVHHLHYETFGKERPQDLLVVCLKCHAAEDEKREQRTERRQAQKLHDARLEGWASKVFGEEWRETEDEEYVEERFNDWLDRQE